MRRATLTVITFEYLLDLIAVWFSSSLDWGLDLKKTIFTSKKLFTDFVEINSVTTYNKLLSVDIDIVLEFDQSFQKIQFDGIKIRLNGENPMSERGFDEVLIEFGIAFDSFIPISSRAFYISFHVFFKWPTFFLIWILI